LANHCRSAARRCARSSSNSRSIACGAPDGSIAPENAAAGSRHRLHLQHHEYETLGAEQSLKAIAPKPRDTAFWLHLGANLAARDWYDSLGDMTPLPGADSQRYLEVSPQLLDAAGQTSP